MLKVIVACEESQVVAKAFRRLGHDAYSCDIQDCSGGHPDWHIKDSIHHVLCRPLTMFWDLIIAHPPCTFLSNSGVRWLYNNDGSRNEKRWDDMKDGAIFFRSLLHANCDAISIENPIIHKHALRIIGQPPTQVIQPWQFGHGETKATCLWLKGLPRLKATNVVAGREQRIWKLPPSPERQKLRSKTYEGIAEAMATQWSDYLTSPRKKIENKKQQLLFDL